MLPTGHGGKTRISGSWMVSVGVEETPESGSTGERYGRALSQSRAVKFVVAGDYST